MARLAAKRWIIRPENRARAVALSQAVGVSPITAQLLINRGIDTPEAAREFLSPSTAAFFSPFLMKDMELAVETIRNAVKQSAPIAIYGDYDADGVTSAAVLLLTLARLGIEKVGYYIPDRLAEGYGVNEEAIRDLAARGFKLVVTVDCGITACREVELAKELGMEMVITDHHQPGSELPRAKAVVNPHRKDCGYPFSDLAGVGVAFKLAQALLCSLGGEPEDWSAVGKDLLDLATIGTVADVVPMYGENRAIVKAGLRQLGSTEKVGLRSLLRTTGLLGKRLVTEHIGYILAPRLNALGRLADAKKAVELLTTTDDALADAIASDLNMYNAQRRDIEASILNEAVEMVESQGMAEDRVLVLAKSGWHHGVIGIVASRLVERYYRPVVMISLADGVGKGSARSIPGFDLFHALQLCEGLLDSYGGHTMAAGLTVQESQIPALREQLNEIAGRWLTPEDFVPSLNADVEISLDELNLNLMDELDALQPFGEGNPVPVMVSRNVPLCGFRTVGKNEGHLSLELSTGTGQVHGIFFRAGELEQELVGLTSLDIAFVPEVHEWNGTMSVQLVIQDIAASSSQLRMGLLAKLGAAAEKLQWMHAYENPAAEMTDGYATAAAVSETEPTLQRMMWWDGRNENKGEYLKSLLNCSSNQLVIWVNRPYYATLLAANIQHAFPSLAGRITAWSQYWPESLRGEIIEEHRQQPWRVVVTDAPLLPTDLLSPNPDFVIYHLPPGSEWLEGLARQCEECDGELHLLYDQKDQAQACQLLKSAWPDADQLRLLYVALSKLTRGGQTEVGLVCRTLSQRRGLSPLGVKRAIAVLADLGLCRCVNGVIAMQSAPEKKLDLYSSVKYNEIVCAVNSAETWFATALREDIETLRKLVVRN